MTWFHEWLLYHLRVHPRADWPKKNTDEFAAFFNNWRRAFENRNVTEEEATEATQWLSEHEPVFTSGQLAVILNRIVNRRLLQDMESRTAHRRVQDLVHEQRVDRQQILIEKFRALPEAMIAKIREDVLDEFPFLRIPVSPERFTEACCVARAVQEGLLDESEPQSAPSP